MRDVNRANWDTWAALHGQDAYYDSAGLADGKDPLSEVELGGLRAALGDGGVRGRQVLHVQCHIGFDSIALARRGAHVTAVDFSPVALAKAAELAARCRVRVDIVEADSTELPDSLAGRFDLAYATIGVLCWIGDVDAWMRSVAATLRPGGRLLLIDGHPVNSMVGSTDPLVLDYPYAYDGPHTFECTGSYAGVRADTTCVQYPHSLGEIVTAAVDAGLRVVRLTEHLESPADLRGQDGPEPDGWYRLRVNGYPLPMLYTLIAERS